MLSAVCVCGSMKGLWQNYQEELHKCEQYSCRLKCLLGKVSIGNKQGFGGSGEIVYKMSDHFETFS